MLMFHLRDSHSLHSQQSLPISTVLQKLTISCLSESPPPSLANPITLNDPPFVITSTSDKAFLAGLTFTWAGTGSGDQHGTIDVNQVTSIEHWVEVSCYLKISLAASESTFTFVLMILNDPA